MPKQVTTECTDISVKDGKVTAKLRGYKNRRSLKEVFITNQTHPLIRLH